MYGKLARRLNGKLRRRQKHDSRCCNSSCMIWSDNSSNNREQHVSKIVLKEFLEFQNPVLYHWIYEWNVCLQFNKIHFQFMKLIIDFLPFSIFLIKLISIIQLRDFIITVIITIDLNNFYFSFYILFVILFTYYWFLLLKLISTKFINMNHQLTDKITILQQHQPIHLTDPSLSTYKIQLLSCPNNNYTSTESQKISSLRQILNNSFNVISLSLIKVHASRVLARSRSREEKRSGCRVAE